jgi:CBS domain containing-hemolysin-like protein
LFVATARQIFPQTSLGTITTVLTAVTLFFGEIMPKAFAVSNSELIIRRVRVLFYDKIYVSALNLLIL